MAIEPTRTKWGYAKFGTGRRIPAVVIAIPGGLLLGVAGGWLAALTGVAGAHPVLGFWVFAFCLTMPAAALVFAAIVDRETLEGATERPDDSIESRWYDKAASGSFGDLILLLGLASAGLAFLPREFLVDLKLIFPSVIVVCFISFGIRFLVLRRKG